jgi:hypothetical protein
MSNVRAIAISAPSATTGLRHVFPFRTGDRHRYSAQSVLGHSAMLAVEAVF